MLLRWGAILERSILRRTKESLGLTPWQLTRHSPFETLGGIAEVPPKIDLSKCSEKIDLEDMDIDLRDIKVKKEDE